MVNTDDVTHTYTFAATVNSSPAEYDAALTAIDAPMLVVVGSNDEAFVAEQYPTAVAEYSDGEVHILAGKSHNTIAESAAAMTLIERWLGDAQLATQN